MSTYTPATGILETVVNDEDMEDTVTPVIPEPKMSRSLTTVYNSAMKAGKAQDARSCRICAELRAKREGTPTPFDDVAQVAPKKVAQTSFNDF